MIRNLLLQRRESLYKSTGRFPQVNHQFVLGTRIREPCAKIDHEILRNVRYEAEYRFDVASIFYKGLTIGTYLLNGLSVGMCFKGVTKNTFE